MSERKDNDLQIQRGGVPLLNNYAVFTFKQLLATQTQQVQTGWNWYNCIPSLAQSYSYSLTATLSEHLKGKKGRQIFAWWCCDREVIQTMPPKQNFPKDCRRKQFASTMV